MKKFLNSNKLIIFVIFICAVLFLPGFFTYFHQDDFIHFSVSQNFTQVIRAFNIFQKGEFPFYRPIPTQLYFFVGQTLFGLNPLGFHLVNFLIFAVNIFLVFRLVKLITKNKIISTLAVFFFAVNSTNFAPLYAAAYVHELFYVMFGILTVDNFLRKKYVFSILFFVLALMSKETAVVLPLILLLTDLFLSKQADIKKIIVKIIPFLTILGIYLFAHYFFYGIAQGSSYALILGKPTLNILVWYFLWALSTPNILIDFIGPGLRINPVFFQVTKFQGILYFLFFPLLMFIGILIIYGVKQIQHDKKIQLILFGVAWFVIGMIPLIIFPLHKLATEQAFSLVGLSIAIAVLLNSFINIRGVLTLVLPILFIVTYLVIAVNSILLARKTHWIIRSAQQAKNAIDFVQSNYPDLRDDATFYFRNGEVKIAPYGSSRQLYQALGNGYGLKLILNKPNLRLYFEDLGQIPKLDKEKEIIQIDSSQLLGY